VRARSSSRILGAARQLIDEGGTDDLSMRRLAIQADVSVRTIYNLFGDKQGVFAALVRDSFDVMDAEVDQLVASDPIERIWEAVSIAIDVNCRYVPRAVVAAVATDITLAREVADSWPGRTLILDAIRTATRSRALRDDVRPGVLMEQAGTVFLHLLWRWSRGEIDQVALTARALHAFDLCLLAVATPRTRSRLLTHLDELDSVLPPGSSPSNTVPARQPSTNGAQPQ
jgi:AcrR family transcriptional regulator